MARNSDGDIPRAFRHENVTINTLCGRKALTEECTREWIRALLCDKYSVFFERALLEKFRELNLQDALLDDDRKYVARAILRHRQHLFVQQPDGLYASELDLCFHSDPVVVVARTSEIPAEPVRVERRAVTPAVPVSSPPPRVPAHVRHPFRIRRVPVQAPPKVPTQEEQGSGDEGDEEPEPDGRPERQDQEEEEDAEEYDEEPRAEVDPVLQQILRILEEKGLAAEPRGNRGDPYAYHFAPERGGCPISGATHDGGLYREGYTVNIAYSGQLFLRCRSQACKKEALPKGTPAVLSIGRLDPDVNERSEGENLVLGDTGRLFTMFSNHRVNGDQSWLSLHRGVEHIDEPELPPLDRWMTGSERIGVVIKSAMDTKKTTRVKEFLEREGHRYKRVLNIMCRQSMTDDALGRFAHLGFADYRAFGNDVVGLQNQDRLAIQIDSLHKLRCPFATGVDCAAFEPFQQYDLIIFDEISYAMQHLSYRKMKNKKENADVLQYYIRNTPNFIGLCADYNHKGAEFLTLLRDDLVLVWNTAPPPIRKSVLVYESDGAWDIALLEQARQGKAIAVPTNSKIKGQVVRRKLLEAGVGENEILVVDGESDKETRALLRDCNTHFRECRILIYTPTIGPGVDFHEDHFDSIFAYGIRTSNTAREFVQSIGRIRKTREIHLYCGNDATPNQYSVLAMWQLNEYVCMSLEGFRKHLDSDFFVPKMDLRTGLYHFPGAETDPLFRVMCHNVLDRNNSRTYFRTLTLRALANIGYDVQAADPRATEEAIMRQQEQTKEMKGEIREEEVERVVCVEQPIAPPPLMERYDHQMTPANQAWEFDDFYKSPGAHRDKKFYEKWKNFSLVLNAADMTDSAEELFKGDVMDLETNPSTILGRTSSNFVEAVNSLLQMCGWDGIWDPREIEEPPLEDWKNHPRKKFIVQTLGIQNASRDKSALTPMGWVLKSKFGLGIETLSKQKRENRKRRRENRYRIDPRLQKELFKVMRAKYEGSNLYQKIVGLNVPQEFYQ